VNVRARLVRNFAEHDRLLAATVERLGRLDGRQLRLVLGAARQSLPGRREANWLLVHLAGPELRAKVVDQLLRQAACDEIRSVYYLAAVGTVGTELVRAEMPALVDGVVSGAVKPDCAHLLPLLWVYEDYPQLVRVIKFVEVNGCDYNKQALAEFREEYDPDDLLDHVRPWWSRRVARPRPAAGSRGGADSGDGAGAGEASGEGSGDAEGRSPLSDDEARQAWAAYSAALTARRDNVARLLERDWRPLVLAAWQSPDDSVLARLVLMPEARRQLRTTLEELGDEVETRIVPRLLESVGVDVSLTAQGVVQANLADAGFPEAARLVRRRERERIGIYGDHHLFLAPRPGV
jgi:hypothetical protein